MEASPEQAAEGLAIVRVLAAVLDRLVFANSPIARADPGQVTKFHAMKAPGIAIQQYLERYVCLSSRRRPHPVALVRSVDSHDFCPSYSQNSQICVMFE